MHLLTKAFSGARERGIRWALQRSGRYLLNTLNINYPASRWQSENSAGNTQARFEEIHNGNLWGSAESVSGWGSTLENTATYRRELVGFLREKGIRSIFDAPSGDMNWMPRVLAEVDIDYLGGDIVLALVETNRRTHSHLRFQQFDITRDSFPETELWHCRDCMMHLSFAQVWASLEGFAASSMRYALLTSYAPWGHRNRDITPGDWQPINLRAPPFHLPRPLAWLKDYRLGAVLPRFVGVWNREQIQSALGR